MRYTEIDNATGFDELIGGPEIETLTANVKLEAGTAMRRGTLMTRTGDTAAATASGGKADCILAENVDKTATGAVVYTRGRFNREKVIAAEGDTAEAHEAELRPFDILFTSLKPLNE